MLIEEHTDDMGEYDCFAEDGKFTPGQVWVCYGRTYEVTDLNDDQLKGIIRKMRREGEAVPQVILNEFMLRQHGF